MGNGPARGISTFFSKTRLFSTSLVISRRFRSGFVVVMLEGVEMCWKTCELEILRKVMKLKMLSSANV